MGGDPSSVKEIDIGEPLDMEELQKGIAGEYKIVKPSGELVPSCGFFALNSTSCLYLHLGTTLGKLL